MLQPATQAKAGDLAELIRIVRSIRIALLTTVGRDGEFHTRPVQTLQVDADGTLWFFTDWTSPKVTELHQDASVSLGYADLAKNTMLLSAAKASCSGITKKPRNCGVPSNKRITQRPR